ncbi:unnamed protein product [Phaeothamnion confervicola]
MMEEAEGPRPRRNTAVSQAVVPNEGENEGRSHAKTVSFGANENEEAEKRAFAFTPRRSLKFQSTIAEIFSIRANKEKPPPTPHSSLAAVTKYRDDRPTRYLTYYQQTVVILIIMAVTANFAWHQVKLCLEENTWYRAINLAWLPATCLFMLFSVNFIVGQGCCALGPIAHMQTNSTYYSAVEAPTVPGLQLPAITIQMPVYKEDLEATILPSLLSLEAAMLHYAKAGGKAGIFINDDGLQVLEGAARSDRLRVYRAARGLAFVARPPSDRRERKGMFKKASNMNYCLNVADLVDCLMTDHPAVADSAVALAAVRASMDDEFEGGGDVRIGDIILLVDSDTRVPVDCLSKIATEFLLSPELGFLQCRTTPLRSPDDNYWQSMISYFTEQIYDVGIAVSVSAGDVAPLVGHNAFLRFEALKRASWVGDDGERKFWSEHHVSEDFDMSLRLQTLGYIGRYCIYTGSEFKEGVSLTAVDEVTRLRKYAFGACEMMLNPLMDWPCKGPITELYWEFLTSSSIPWPTKLTLTGYLGTYLSMGFAIWGIVAYILLRIYLPSMQDHIVTAFDVTLTVIFTFGVVGMFGAATIRFRMGYSDSRSICQAWWTQIRHSPVVTLFFGHVLWHLSTAIASYFFHHRLDWGATSKTIEQRTFWQEVVATLRHYRQMYLAMTAVYCGFGVLMWFYEMSWGDVRLVFPITLYVGLHLVGPFLLNPSITRGYY